MLHDYEHLFIYTKVLSDIIAAMASENYVEPVPKASKSIIYRQLLEDLKSPV